MRKNKFNYDMFLTHEDVKNLLDNAHTISCWDFNTALGNTLEERCRSLSVVIAAVTGAICSKGGSGYFSIVVGPELALIMDSVGLISRDSLESEDHLITEFPNGISYFGLMKNRWGVYCDLQMTTCRLLVGAHLNAKQPQSVARISLANFIF